MAQQIGVIDQHGQVHQVSVGMEALAEARAGGFKHVPAMFNARFPTRKDQPSASQQMYAQMGAGQKNLKLNYVLQGQGFSAGAVTEDSSIAGRLVALPYLMDTLENKLTSSDYGIQALFNRKAAAIDTINGTKFDRPFLNFSRPESARSRAVTQLGEPASMLTLTTSDKSWKIAGSSIGMEISDEAAAATSLDIVSLSMTRQAEVEALERIEGQLLAFLSGDSDLDMAALSTVSGAVKNAKTAFDSSLTVAGTLSQKAWVNWLFYGSRVRRIDTVITDLAGALAIENRSGRPVVVGDNATSKRIDTLDTVVNPSWPDQVDVIISQDPNWPANTIVGFDSRYAYHIVNSTTLSYTAMEQFAIRRSTKLRVDTGSIAYRLFDDAWQVLTLTV
jgi:hypothetical protein